MNSSLLNEVKKLDSDLKEIYGEFGTEEIYLKKYIVSDEVDIYGYPKENYYSEPLKLLGRVRVNHLDEVQTTIGGRVEQGVYTFYLVTSKLKDFGVECITTDDVMHYMGNDLDIVSATPVTILGDFALQYKVVAVGKNLVNPHFGE